MPVARVVELVDTGDLKSPSPRGARVRVSPRACRRMADPCGFVTVAVLQRPCPSCSPLAPFSAWRRAREWWPPPRAASCPASKAKWPHAPEEERVSPARGHCCQVSGQDHGMARSSRRARAEPTNRVTQRRWQVARDPSQNLPGRCSAPSLPSLPCFDASSNELRCATSFSDSCASRPECSSR
jgi:hypothetical protein